MITIEGLCGIKVTILADSISKAGKRMLTFELEYPRLILAELNTHKMLSKNSYSSRAVPFEKMLKQLQGRPVRFGANQAGMQDKGEDFDALVRLPVDMGMEGVQLFPYTNVQAWEIAKQEAIKMAQAFKEAGYHKQVYNRLLEPWQMQKTVLSGTETSNFFWLRDHGDADPTIAELARCMREAVEASEPETLHPGEWHLPYVDYDMDDMGRQLFYLEDEVGVQTILSLEDAIKVSCARCAAVSYRNEGYGLEKSIELYERLIGSDRKHASALEHCATPVREYGYYPSTTGGPMFIQNNLWVPMTWEEGITHVDRKGRLWSGNLCGWIQHRKLIPGENYDGNA
jgi:hypothetical protein